MNRNVDLHGKPFHEAFTDAFKDQMPTEVSTPPVPWPILLSFATPDDVNLFLSSKPEAIFRGVVPGPYGIYVLFSWQAEFQRLRDEAGLPPVKYK